MRLQASSLRDFALRAPPAFVLVRIAAVLPGQAHHCRGPLEAAQGVEMSVRGQDVLVETSGAGSGTIWE
jgi:hypothetical protein